MVRAWEIKYFFPYCGKILEYFPVKCQGLGFSWVLSCRWFWFTEFSAKQNFSFRNLAQTRYWFLLGSFWKFMAFWLHVPWSRFGDLGKQHVSLSGIWRCCWGSVEVDLFMALTRPPRDGGVWGGTCPVLLWVHCWGRCWEVAHPSGGMPWGASPSPAVRQMDHSAPAATITGQEEVPLHPLWTPLEGRGAVGRAQGDQKSCYWCLLAASMHVSTCAGVCACMWG